MPAYFTSDVHLRLDRPERGRRFARWLSRLEPNDSLTIAGDLCDFWFASRQCDGKATTCEGLRALADYRDRGGRLTILPGNHDAWLEPLYKREIGIGFAQEPLDVEAYGLRIRLVHGHHVGWRTGWKGWMESRRFLSAFQRLPGPLASTLDLVLERRNERRRDVDDRRHLAAYREFARSLAGTVDIVFIGHIHRTIDEAHGGQRLVIPGGWHRQSSYLKVDDAGAALILEADPHPLPR